MTDSDPAATQVRIVLVRHGESEWNAAGIVQGQSGPGLTPGGHWQAGRTAEALRDLFPEAKAIVRSDLIRVAETADPYERIAGLPVRLDKRLREIDNGSWVGKPHAQVREEYAAEFAAIGRGEDIPRGGAETFGQLRERSRDALHDIARDAAVDRGSDQPHAPTVIVFTHGGVITAAVSETFGLPVSGHHLVGGPRNCSITVLGHTVNAFGQQAISVYLDSFNRDDHLLDLSGRDLDQACVLQEQHT